MPGHQGENLYKIGPNKFMGGGGVCGRGEKGGAFCSVCIFHNQKMHVYLIFVLFSTQGQIGIIRNLTINGRSIDGVLGIRTLDRKIVGAEVSRSYNGLTLERMFFSSS